MGDHQSMKSWPLIMALLVAPTAGAEALKDLVEIAPWVRLDRQGPPEPGRSYRAARPSSGPRRWSVLALPGSTIQLALTPVAPEDVVLALIDGRQFFSVHEVEGFIPNVWLQSSSMVPDGSAERVAEVLTRPAAEFFPSSYTAVPGATPLAVRIVDFRVPGDQRAGDLRATVTINGEVALSVDITVLAPLPTVPVEPVLAFYRGRLVPEAQADWPELVDERGLLQDLRWLRQAGVTHATYYGSPDTLPSAERLWREAGFTTEPLLVGWYPGPMASTEERQVREAIGRVRALRTTADGEPRVFWTVDEPVREELQLARSKAAMIREGGGLSTAAVQSETAHALRHDIDLHLMDNYLSPRPVFEAAVRSVRSAGSTPWGYWQSFGESARFSRWNAGFRQLDEPTRGQAFYAYAHAVGDPFDDFDGDYRDMLMVHAPNPRVRLSTLQFEGLRLGLEDLRIARGAQALVREAKMDGLEHRSVSALERELDRARRKWSSAHARWARYDWDDVARPGRGGPPAAALERTRQDILKAVADLQATRAETTR